MSNEFVIDNPIRDNKHTYVVCTDEKGAGGAHHIYEVRKLGTDEVLDTVKFHEGALLEVGDVNGAFNEDYLAILIHRCQCFLDGPFPSYETQRAQEHMVEAVAWLNHRTHKRDLRGVEGRDVK